MNYSETIEACEVAAENLWQVVEDGGDASGAQAAFNVSLCDLRSALVVAAKASRDDFDVIATKLNIFQCWANYLAGRKG